MAAILAACLFGTAPTGAAAGEEQPVRPPEWFKADLIDLRADLADARLAGKTGLMLFFHTPACSYCKALLRTTFSEAEVVRRLRAGFDVIALDVLSDVELTDLEGRTHWASRFAVEQKAAFTPTLVFYGDGGKRLLRLVGYQSPSRFLAVLDYLEQRGYETQSLRAFLAQRDTTPPAQVRGPVDPLFARPPYILDRRLAPGQRPLLVLFERTACPSCERFQRVALRHPAVREVLARYEAVRLDMNDAETRLITPAGDTISARDWADDLGLLHAPALVFFDEQGGEVLRLDSELLIDARGRPVEASDPEFVANIADRLRYVLTKGYLEQPQFQQWRRRHTDGATRTPAPAQEAHR